MEYVYAALLLHKAGKEITEESVTNTLKGAGVDADPARVKALVAALDGVNIEEAIEKAAMPVAAAPAAAAAAGGDAPAAPEKKEEKKEEKKSAEEAAAGLGALFG